MCSHVNNHISRMLGWAEMLSESPKTYLSGVNQTQMAQSLKVFESFNVTPASTIAA
jgi:hypothetical protein